MLQNAYFRAKIGADTAENKQHLAENLPKNGKLPYGSASALPRRWRSARSSACTPAAASGHERRERRLRDRFQFLAKFRQNVARFRLYRRRSFQVTTRFAAFFKIQ